MNTSSKDKLATQEIDDIINSHGGWKGEVLSQLRSAIKQADPSVVEEIKWKMKTRPEGLPVWSHSGIVCFAEVWKDNIKLLFPKGAQIKDSKKLFNARLKSKDIRAIEFRDGDGVDGVGLRELVLEAVKLNEARGGR